MALLPYGIVPPRLVFSVVGKEVHNKLVDLGQREHLARSAVDRHVYHRNVARERVRGCFGPNYSTKLHSPDLGWIWSP